MTHRHRVKHAPSDMNEDFYSLVDAGDARAPVQGNNGAQAAPHVWPQTLHQTQPHIQAPKPRRAAYNDPRHDRIAGGSAPPMANMGTANSLGAPVNVGPLAPQRSIDAASYDDRQVHHGHQGPAEEHSNGMMDCEDDGQNNHAQQGASAGRWA